MRFHDRADAGRRLSHLLTNYKLRNPVILALPRGGVAVAAEVAGALNAPLDILIVRKVGAPIQPELALGAIVDGTEPIIVRNPAVIESTATSEDEFQALCRDELREIERRRKVFAGGRAPVDIGGRVVIVVDDGIATGATMRAALRAIRVRKPKELVLATPVAPEETLQELRSEVDNIVCITDLKPWGAIGYFYDDFRQLTDQDVKETLALFPSADVSAKTSGAVTT